MTIKGFEECYTAVQWPFIRTLILNYSLSWSKRAERHFSQLTGREVLELSAAMHGLDVPSAMDELTPTIRDLRLMDDIDDYAEDYSRGMKKKLGLLLAMLHQPKLLVLDEPTNGLDVESTHLFYDLILRKASEGTHRTECRQLEHAWHLLAFVFASLSMVWRSSLYMMSSSPANDLTRSEPERS